MRRKPLSVELLDAVNGVTTFLPGYEPTPATHAFNQETGFFEDANRGLLAFTAGIPAQHPPRTAADLLPEDRKFMNYPKGIGTRIANIPHALIEPLRHKKQQDLYAISVSPVTERGTLPDGSPDVREIYDESDLPKVRGYVRHLGLLAINKRKDAEAAWQALDKQRGEGADAAAIRLALPPSWQDEHHLRGISYPAEPEMLLLRDSDIRVDIIGTVALDALLRDAKN